MIYYAGLAGAYETAIICRDKSEELLNIFPHQLMERAIQVLTESNGSDTMDFETLVTGLGGTAFCPITRDGSFKALWDLGELTKSGLEITLSRIPVSPETIEISEYFDLNPYRMDSRGAFVYVAEKVVAKQIQMALNVRGIKSVPIGRLTNKADRIVRYDNNVHYLTPRGE